MSKVSSLLQISVVIDHKTVRAGISIAFPDASDLDVQFGAPLYASNLPEFRVPG